MVNLNEFPFESNFYFTLEFCGAIIYFFWSGSALSLRKKIKCVRCALPSAIIIKPKIIGIRDLQGGFWKVESLLTFVYTR